MDYNKAKLDGTDACNGGGPCSPTPRTMSGDPAVVPGSAITSDIAVDLRLQQATFPGEVRLSRADLERALMLLNYTPPVPKRPTLNTARMEVTGDGGSGDFHLSVPVDDVPERKCVSIQNRCYAEYTNRGLFLGLPPAGTRWAVVHDSDDCDVLTLVDA